MRITSTDSIVPLYKGMSTMVFPIVVLDGLKRLRLKSDTAAVVTVKAAIE